ncbi:coiled-coil domain-containing protein 85 [Brevipalpus obovatus]|uniref:coiled-coil domain-containing protein 85 n=1 Tax=Brevipalpus obovatus TaxID=246614 RepID=UPI003D9F0D49
MHRNQYENDIGAFSTHNKKFQKEFSMDNSSIACDKNQQLQLSGPYQYPGSRADFVNLTPSIIAPSSTPSNELINQLSADELKAQIRSLEAKNRKLLYDNGTMTRDLNNHLSSLQQIKQENTRVLSENDELRNLCCSLQEERTRCRTIAREWQAFGTHISRVIGHEITNYSNKLAQLEGKQLELVKENLQLKQLCLLLDNELTSQERNGPVQHPLSPQTSMSSDSLPSANTTKQSLYNSTTNMGSDSSVSSQNRMTLSLQILEYVRSLEEHIKFLENGSSTVHNRASPPTALAVDQPNDSLIMNQDLRRPACPQSLLKAMKVFRIHEQVNKDFQHLLDDHVNRKSPEAVHINNSASYFNSPSAITDQQKAIINGLCNVVWDKIEETP